MSVTAPSKFIRLTERIHNCEHCAEHLPLGPRPVFQANPKAKILIVGQAPGTAVHKTGITFNDPSGKRLRDWLGMSTETFYNEALVAIVPMGFCYPGRGKGGDLPPRPECAAMWRAELLSHLPNIKLTIAIGRYAIDWHLKPKSSMTLQAIVAGWKVYLPEFLPLPHPSPRNTMWLQKNPWVEAEIIPTLRSQVSEILGNE